MKKEVLNMGIEFLFNKKSSFGVNLAVIYLSLFKNV